MITSDLELLRRITELTPTFIAYIDTNERYTHVNSYYTKRLGLTREQIIGRQIREVLGADTYERLRTHVRHVLSGENVQFEERFHTPGGNVIHVSVNYTPDFDLTGQVRGFISLAHDITEKHAIEQELRRSKEEAQAAVRLRDEFLSIASHELRTPLTSLYLHLQLVGRMSTGDPETARRIALTTRQAQRLGTLIDSLLDVSRFTNGKLRLEKEEFELISVVQEVISRLSPEAKATGSTLSLSAPDFLTGTWDKLRMEQVCTNLISNAIKYGQGKPVEVRITKDDQHVRIAVVDQGLGVVPEDQKKIFQRFERVGSVGNSAGGLGLGLYIADQIMRAHGGRIRLESVPDQGSTFTAEFPLT